MAVAVSSLNCIDKGDIITERGYCLSRLVRLRIVRLSSMEGGYSTPLARTHSSSTGSRSPEQRKFVAMESANILSKNTMEREQVL